MAPGTARESSSWYNRDYKPTCKMEATALGVYKAAVSKMVPRLQALFDGQRGMYPDEPTFDGLPEMLRQFRLRFQKVVYSTQINQTTIKHLGRRRGVREYLETRDLHAVLKANAAILELQDHPDVSPHAEYLMEYWLGELGGKRLEEQAANPDAFAAIRTVRKVQQTFTVEGGKTVTKEVNTYPVRDFVKSLQTVDSLQRWNGRDRYRRWMHQADFSDLPGVKKQAEGLRARMKQLHQEHQYARVVASTRDRMKDARAGFVLEGTMLLTAAEILMYYYRTFPFTSMVEDQEAAERLNSSHRAAEAELRFLQDNVNVPLGGDVIKAAKFNVANILGLGGDVKGPPAPFEEIVSVKAAQMREVPAVVLLEGGEGGDFDD